MDIPPACLRASRYRSLGLGFVLKYFRLRARIKQKELARRIGTSTSHLSLIESEKRPANTDLLVRASGALGIPVEIPP